MTDLVAEDHMTTETSPRFLACMPFILKEEGGYSNTPGDHGGPTDRTSHHVTEVLVPG